MGGPGEASALRRGGRDAFAAWVEALHPRVLRYARRKLGSLEDALDVAQETFVAAFGGLPSAPREPDQRTSWLFGIASHKVADAARSRARHQDRQRPLEGEVPAPGDTARDALARDEKAQVLAALAEVDEPFGEALTLVAIDGLRYQDVAALQGCPVGTVRSRVAKARQLLRAALARRGARP